MVSYLENRKYWDEPQWQWPCGLKLQGKITWLILTHMLYKFLLSAMLSYAILRFWKFELYSMQVLIYSSLVRIIKCRHGQAMKGLTGPPELAKAHLNSNRVIELVLARVPVIHVSRAGRQYTFLPRWSKREKYIWTGPAQRFKSHTRGEKEFCFMSMYIGQNTSQIFPWVQKKYKLLMMHGPRI